MIKDSVGVNKETRDFVTLFAQRGDFNKHNGVEQWETGIKNTITGTDKGKYFALAQLSFIADANGDYSVTESDIKNVFQTIDINNDGKLDADEVQFVRIFAGKDQKRGLSMNDRDALNEFKAKRTITSSTVIDADDIRDAQVYLFG
jgi:flagella basal body P-ring formation protein FlgA